MTEARHWRTCRSDKHSHKPNWTSCTHWELQDWNNCTMSAGSYSAHTHTWQTTGLLPYISVHSPCCFLCWRQVMNSRASNSQPETWSHATPMREDTQKTQKHPSTLTYHTRSTCAAIFRCFVGKVLSRSLSKAAISLLSVTTCMFNFGVACAPHFSDRKAFWRSNITAEKRTVEKVTLKTIRVNSQQNCLLMMAMIPSSAWALGQHHSSEIRAGNQRVSNRPKKCTVHFCCLLNCRKQCGEPSGSWGSTEAQAAQRQDCEHSNERGFQRRLLTPSHDLSTVQTFHASPCFVIILNFCWPDWAPLTLFLKEVHNQNLLPGMGMLQLSQMPYLHVLMLLMVSADCDICSPQCRSWSLMYWKYFEQTTRKLSHTGTFTPSLGRRAKYKFAFSMSNTESKQTWCTSAQDH